jgi:hypothetical protein
MVWERLRWLNSKGTRRGFCMGAMLMLAMKPQWVHYKLDETIEQSCSDFLAQTLDVLIEFHDSSTFVIFMVVDMYPHLQTSIILGKPFLKSVRVTIYKKRGIINMKVDRVHDKFIYHPKNLTCCC